MFCVWGVQAYAVGDGCDALRGYDDPRQIPRDCLILRPRRPALQPAGVPPTSPTNQRRAFQACRGGLLEERRGWTVSALLQDGSLQVCRGFGLAEEQTGTAGEKCINLVDSGRPT